MHLRLERLARYVWNWELSLHHLLSPNPFFYAPAKLTPGLEKQMIPNQHIPTETSLKEMCRVALLTYFTLLLLLLATAQQTRSPSKQA